MYWEGPLTHNNKRGGGVGLEALMSKGRIKGFHLPVNAQMNLQVFKIGLIGRFYKDAHVPFDTPIGFNKKILDCVIGRNPRRRTGPYALLGFLPLALPKSFS
jgi:hypothetical protein